MGIIQSDDGLNRKKLTFFEEEKLVSALRWVFSLSVHLADFGLASLHNHIAHLLNFTLSLCLNLSPPIHMCVFVHVYIYIKSVDMFACVGICMYTHTHI